jgi:hypothetical protein
MAGVYTKYRVRRYSYHVTIQSNQTGSTETAFTTWNTNASSTAPATGNLFAAQPDCFSGSNCTPKMVNPLANQPNVFSVEGSYNVLTLIGDPEAHTDDSYCGTITSANPAVFADPSTLTKLHLVTSAFSGTLSGNPTLFVILDQFVEFFAPRND